MPALFNLLHDTNRRLSFCLDNISAKHQAEVVTPAQMSTLLSDLLAAGAGLREQGLPADNDRELESELAEYRRQIERLRDLLPSIHRALLAERARVEAQRTRLQSASEWMRTSRQTL